MSFAQHASLLERWGLAPGQVSSIVQRAPPPDLFKSIIASNSIAKTAATAVHRACETAKRNPSAELSEPQRQTLQMALNLILKQLGPERQQFLIESLQSIGIEVDVATGRVQLRADVAQNAEQLCAAVEQALR